MTIVPLADEHVDAVARLHCARVTGLLSVLGPRATGAFYRGAVRAGSAVGLVCVEGGSVVGAVLGSVHPARLKREALRANPLGTLTGVLSGIARHPAALGWLVKSLRGPEEGSYDGRQAELTYLEVASDREGAGIGRRLVDAFGGAMRDAGVAAYELSVDDDNHPAIAFYERLGFRFIGRYREFGTLHRRYRLELGTPSSPGPGA